MGARRSISRGDAREKKTYTPFGAVVSFVARRGKSGLLETTKKYVTNYVRLYRLPTRLICSWRVPIDFWDDGFFCIISIERF